MREPNELERLKQKFQETVQRYISREGIAGLMAWLFMSDFYTAPASTKYHGAVEGGLVEHSLEVFNELLLLTTTYNGIAAYSSDVPEYLIQKPRWGDVPRYTYETLAIVALFHDICKVDYYKKDYRNVKTESGSWERMPYYTVDEQYCFGGHGSKSVYLIQRYLDLSPDEAAAINCHMGAWDKAPYGDPGRVYERTPLSWLLHVADESATYIRKK